MKKLVWITIYNSRKTNITPTRYLSAYLSFIIYLSIPANWRWAGEQARSTNTSHSMQRNWSDSETRILEECWLFPDVDERKKNSSSWLLLSDFRHLLWLRDPFPYFNLNSWWSLTLNPRNTLLVDNSWCRRAFRGKEPLFGVTHLETVHSSWWSLDLRNELYSRVFAEGFKAASGSKKGK